MTLNLTSIKKTTSNNSESPERGNSPEHLHRANTSRIPAKTSRIPDKSAIGFIE